ncbi:MAG: hypothetical protein LC785_16545 [Acidobacteria bacterium]|nr:hypothetical protein [Acidobacteriota bacterium]MCA1643511.1 hypothetical protein [Acidobacteriota bacterium]
MIIYRKKFVRIAEAWYGEEPDARGVDIARGFQREEPAPGGALCREFYTILIDLTRDPDSLLSGLKRGCRYKIRRAEARDGVVYECANAARRPDLLARFREMYDEFAPRKNLPAIDPAWLSLMTATGGLFVSRAARATGDALVWHTHFLSGGRATLLHSASPPAAEAAGRNLIGRANRFHHWRDMLHFKSEGAILYDLGGWYQGDSDARRLGINRFKEDFGGDVVKNYITERGLTVRGKLFLRARTLLLGDAI